MIYQFHLSVRAAKDRTLMDQRMVELRAVMDRFNGVYGDFRKWQRAHGISQQETYRQLLEALALQRHRFEQQQLTQPFEFVDMVCYQRLEREWLTYWQRRQRPPTLYRLGDLSMAPGQTSLLLEQWPSLVLLETPSQPLNHWAYCLQPGLMEGIYRLCLFQSVANA